MLFGYARISQDSQSLDLQIDALTAAGCERIFSDTMSGSRNDRPGLKQALEFARHGDSLCVWRLDRLGRSLSHLIQTMKTLNERGIQFVSLTEAIDTRTPGGRLAFNLFSCLSEFEKNVLVERTRSGLLAAKKRGRLGGRPRLMTTEKYDAAKRLLDTGTPVKDIAAAIGVSIPTVYRHLAPSRPVL